MNISYIVFGVLIAIIFLLVILWILRKMKGSIDIIPERYSYSSGEIINGRLILKLKKPVSSNKLIVGLKCEKIAKSYSANSRNSQAKNYTLFEFNQPLEEKKEYAPSEYNYDFSIKIPQNVSQQLEGVASSIVKSAQILMGKNTLIKWYLYAELQCEGVNLSKKVQLNIV